MVETIQTLKNMYEKVVLQKTELLTKKSNLLNEINKKNEYKKTLINLHLQLEEKEAPQTSQFPIIVGNASTRMSILDLGKLPPVNTNKEAANCSNTNNELDDRTHTQQYIYPIGYKAKRRYNKHPNCKRSDEKVFYIMHIKNNEKEISCCDKKWTNWDEFKSEVGGEIKTVEEFFGLDNLAVMKLIESQGDVSVYKGYVPVSERENRNKEANNEEE
ncbi:hypothetical protein BDAP_002266 [Binucleata daphniae]